MCTKIQFSRAGCYVDLADEHGYGRLMVAPRRRPAGSRCAGCGGKRCGGRRIDWLRRAFADQAERVPPVESSNRLLYMRCRLSFNPAMGSLIGKGKPGAIRGRKATGPTRSAGLPISKGSVMHAQNWIISTLDVGCGPSLCRTLGNAEKGHTLPG
jgi:hypothetical protein